MNTTRKIRIEKLNSRRLFAADLGVPPLPLDSPDPVDQQVVAKDISVDQAEGNSLQDIIAILSHTAAVDAAVTQLADEGLTGNGDVEFDKSDFVVGPQEPSQFSLPDLRGTYSYVADDNAPGNTPFGPTMLPNKDDTDNKKDCEASDDEAEELTDEEVDKLVQFKAPSHFWIHDNPDGSRTVRFVR